MIDFIHPRSKITKYDLALTLASLVILGFGGFVTFAKFNEYYTAKKLTTSSYLPSGDYLLHGGYGQHNDDLKNLLTEVKSIESVVTSTMPTEETVVVAGIEYDEAAAIVSTDKNHTTAAQDITMTATEKIPNYNVLVIPKMGVNATINEGATADTLWKGIWRMPQTSTPDEGGNTVISAHRYLYRPPDPRTFFLLDKLVPGDMFYIYWKGQRYDYKVSETKIVDPSEISILYNTANSQVTLFSCTPLFTSDQRLVVIADKM